MKRFVALLLVALLLPVHCSFAEGVDIKGMSLDSLLTLLKLINDEIDCRLQERNNSDILYPYEYIIGTHIPEGMYLVTCSEVADGETLGFIGIKSDEKSKMHEYIKLGETLFIDVKDGDILRIEDCTIRMVTHTLPSF